MKMAAPSMPSTNASEFPNLALPYQQHTLFFLSSLLENFCFQIAAKELSRQHGSDVPFDHQHQNLEELSQNYYLALCELLVACGVIGPDYQRSAWGNLRSKYLEKVSDWIIASSLDNGSQNMNNGG